MDIPNLLIGVRVIDLAGDPGVLASRLLADLGADVIRVETDTDSVRRRGPFLGDLPGVERSLQHLHFNRNKRSVRLDISRPADRADFVRLVRTADALIETFAPGAMDAQGIGYEALRAVNPGLVYTTVTPFGQRGPFRHYRADDLVAVASSGLLYLNGFPGDPPNQPGAEQAYKIGSLVVAAGTLIALEGRRADPGARGRRVDVSLQEAAAMATLQMANANDYLWNRHIPRRTGGVIHQSRDGKWMALSPRVGSQDTFDQLAAWLREAGIETPVTSAAWADQSFRLLHRQAVDEAVAALCARFDRSVLFEEGQRREQMAMPVNDIADLLADEQLAHRRYFISVPHTPLDATLVDAGSPYLISPAPTKPHTRAPLLGEHTAAVLSRLDDHQTPTDPRSGVRAPAIDPTKPLAGLRVADFTWMIAGPTASRMLADFGATVIKIESEYRPDNMRLLGIQPAGKASVDTNPVFNDCNTSKLSVRLNINTEQGLETVKQIIKLSDVVLNNFSGDRMARWGLGYDDLKQLKPDIIMLSMPVMGTTGPYRNYGSYGTGVIAFAGLNMSMGFPQRPPVGTGPLYSDFSAPYFLVIAMLAAMHHRERTGAGLFVDISQTETMLSLLGPAVLRYTADGVLPERMGNSAPDYAPHGVYPCFGDDRWCAIAAATDAEWGKLATLIGGPALAADPRFAQPADRKAHEAELDQVIAAWTRERDPWQVMHLLQGEGVTAAVVEDLEDMVVRDPWLSTKHFVSVPFDEEGFAFRTHGQPVRMDGAVPALRRAPRFGEHSAAVLGGLLGRSEAEIEELIISGAIF